MGKHPAYPYSLVEKGQQVPAPKGYGVGIATGARSDVFVLDIDGPEGVDALPGPLPETYTVATGRGIQAYFRYPGFKVRNSAGELGPKLDIRGDGGFVVAPGTVHKRGVVYSVADRSSIAVAPAWLLEWPGLRGKERAATDATDNAPDPVDMTTAEGTKRASMAREYLATCEPCVQGSNGSAVLWTVANRLVRTLELPVEFCAAVLEEVYNPRCVPPWSKRELWHKLEDARDRSDLPCGLPPENWDAVVEELTKPRALKTPRVLSAGPARRARDANHEYVLEAGASPAADRKKGCLSDAVQALIQNPEWAGVLQWDEFRGRLLAVNPPIRLEAETNGGGLTNDDAGRIVTWFEHNGLAIGEQMAYRAACMAAKKNTFHPVKEYLASVQDKRCPGILDNLATRVLGTTDPLAEEFLTKTLVAAVRRILQPGCRVDTMLVLYGGQGAKKTSFVQELFGDEFVRSQMPDLASRDASGALQGFWCVEIAELDGVLRADNNTVKEFLTRKFDDCRPPYGRVDERFPRQCVFIGTTNENDFLRDPTGNRRYWPVDVSRKIDLAYVKKHRDEIWAEALALAATDFAHWFEEETDADPARENFIQEDPWHGAIADHITGRDWVRSVDVYLEAIAEGDRSQLAKLTRRELLRVTSTLARLGCKQQRRNREKGWAIPDTFRRAVPSAAEVKKREAIAMAKRASGN